MLPSGLPEIVGDDEDLARFLTQRSHFNAIMAKPAAFLPSSKDRETSVSRHGRDPVERLWEIGQTAAGERSLYAAAIFKARAARAAGVNVFADEPPLRHAALRDWPWTDNDPELQKAQQKEIAVVLASAAGTPLLLA
jgi:hypothetical protein